jgi:hypothetical protein
MTVWPYRLIAPFILIGDGVHVVTHGDLWNLVYFANALMVAAAWTLFEYKAAGFTAGSAKK